MTTNREVYEGKILETLIKNSERLAVVEQKIELLDKKIELLELRIDERFDKLNTKINWLFGAVFAVGFGILATLYSQPIINAFNN